MTILRDGDAVLDPDGRRGIIRDVYRHTTTSQPIGVKVAFALGSPYLDDWALFKPDELRPYTTTNKK